MLFGHWCRFQRSLNFLFICNNLSILPLFKGSSIVCFRYLSLRNVYLGRHTILGSMASSSLCFHRRCPSCVGSKICQKIESSASQLRWLVDSLLEKLQSRLASLLSSLRFRLLGLDVIRNGCLCRSFLLLFLYPVRPYFSFSGFLTLQFLWISLLVGFQAFNHCLVHLCSLKNFRLWVFSFFSFFAFNN